MSLSPTQVQEIRTRLNWLDRNQVEDLLRNVGIECYPSETDTELHNAIIANVEDGTIAFDDIPEWK